MQRLMRGVTLMELLVVLVIVSVLATIAYPNYRQFVARSKRTEAKSALLQIATMQERQYLQTNIFTTDLTTLGFTTTPVYITDSGSYSVQVTFADANTFTAVATYLNPDEEGNKCSSFQIDSTGAKTSQPPGSDCWASTR